MRRGFLNNTKASDSDNTGPGRNQRRSSAPEHATSHSENTRPLRSEHRYSSPEHAVFCQMTSRQVFLTSEAAVLSLCRSQEREAGRYYFRAITSIHRIQRSLPPYEPSMTPVGMILASGREPTRFVVARLYYQDLGKAIRCMFFGIWRVVHEMARHGFLLLR